MAKRKYTRRAQPANNNHIAPAMPAPAMVALDSVLPMLSEAQREMISGLLAIGVSPAHAIEATAKLGARANGTPEPAPARRSAIPTRPVADATPAPQRFVRPAVAYRVSDLAQSKEPAVKTMIANLSPRLAVTFDAIRRSRSPLSRREISAATKREPKQTENDVMWLRTRGLIESVALAQ